MALEGVFLMLRCSVSFGSSRTTCMRGRYGICRNMAFHPGHHARRSPGGQGAARRRGRTLARCSAPYPGVKAALPCAGNLVTRSSPTRRAMVLRKSGRTDPTGGCWAAPAICASGCSGVVAPGSRSCGDPRFVRVTQRGGPPHRANVSATAQIPCDSTSTASRRK